jgi:bifunctional non-homologous end joining protein LigD
VTEQMRVGRRDLKVTHPDRIVFPQAGLTKLDLARHYERVAPLMLPYVRDRTCTRGSHAPATRTNPTA